jgi:hypothetical protein
VRQEVTTPVVGLTCWMRNSVQPIFEVHPELHSIWKHELSVIAAHHTQQWEVDPNESGNVLSAHVDDAIVGVMGWYRMTETEAGLRWHGVLPHARQNGYSRQMIDLVCQDMPSEIRCVYEVTRNPQSKAAFCACGFDVVTAPGVIERVVRHAEYGIETGGWVLRKPLNW